MPTGALVMGKKKPDSGKPEPGGGEGEFTEPVKLRRAFKLKLQHVAQDAKKPMGQLVEEMMGAAISREYKRITEENQD